MNKKANQHASERKKDSIRRASRKEKKTTNGKKTQISCYIHTFSYTGLHIEKNFRNGYLVLTFMKCDQHNNNYV